MCIRKLILFLSLVIYLMTIFYSDVLADEITSEVIKEVSRQNKRVKSYIAYYKIYPKDLEVKITYKNRDKIFSEIKSSLGEKVLIGYNEGWRWRKRSSKPNIISKTNIKKIMKDYGEIVRYLVPRDLSMPFEFIIPESLDYLGTKKIREENWGGYVYKFSAERKTLKYNKGVVATDKLQLFVDTEYGIVCKILTFNNEGEIVKRMVVKKMEINPKINNSIFECQLGKESKVQNNTAVWHSFFKEVVEKQIEKYKDEK